MITSETQPLAPVSAAPTGKALRRRRLIGQIERAALLYIIIIPGALLFLMPLLWMLSTALKPANEIFAYPPQLLPNPPLWQNFVIAWTKFAPFTRYALNTMFITVGNVIGNLISCSLAAYGFARLRAPGKNLLFALLLGTMMLPLWVTLIPQYVMFSAIHWTNSYLPLMIPPWFGWPFFIFLLRQFFTGIPRELEDAARMDGASTLTIFWRIIIPLSIPALTTVAVLAFIGNWTNFIGPLIFLRDTDKYTLALALQHFQGMQGNLNYNYMMAVAIIMVLPIIVIFFFAQRYFLQGISISGMKP